jgi:RHH-type proline utilization regulon transcriptional repressor/proline dehydrogenase/delta 1-pyrroline-5-carboxylate dehydrogenase
MVKESNAAVAPKLSDEKIAELTKLFAKDNANSSLIDSMMQRSEQIAIDWAYSDLNTRISALRQLLAQVASDQLMKQQSDLASTITAASSQLLMIEKKLANPTQLPGPTGESNTLHLESRGCLTVIRDQDTAFNFWFIGVVSALAAGNTVIACVDDSYIDQAQVIRDSLNKIGLVQGIFQVAKLSQLAALNGHNHLAGAVVDNKTGLTHVVNQQLAARTGAILPVISAVSYRVLFERLVTEKTISVDTTAAGGNASLMTMDIED